MKLALLRFIFLVTVFCLLSATWLFVTLLSCHLVLRASHVSVCECSVCSCVSCLVALFFWSYPALWLCRLELVLWARGSVYSSLPSCFVVNSCKYWMVLTWGKQQTKTWVWIWNPKNMVAAQSLYQCCLVYFICFILCKVHEVKWFDSFSKGQNYWHKEPLLVW